MQNLKCRITEFLERPLEVMMCSSSCHRLHLQSHYGALAIFEVWWGTMHSISHATYASLSIKVMDEFLTEAIAAWRSGAKITQPNHLSPAKSASVEEGSCLA